MIESPYTVHAPPPIAAPEKTPPRRRRWWLLGLALLLLAALIWKARPLWVVSAIGEQRVLATGALPVRVAIFSDDGKTLFTGGGEGTNPGEICVLDADTGKLLRSWRGHDRQINALALSPDARVLASGGADGRIKLWDVSSGKELKTLAPFDYDPMRMGDIMMKLMNEARDPRTGEMDKSKLRGSGFVLKPMGGGYTLEPDPAMANLPQATYTDAPDGKRVTDPILTLAFSRDGKTLFSASKGGGLLKWSVEKGSAESLSGTGGSTGVLIAEFSADVMWLVKSDSSSWRSTNPKDRNIGVTPLNLWSAQKLPNPWIKTLPHLVGELAQNVDSVTAAAFSPNDKNIGLLSLSHALDGSITGGRLQFVADVQTPMVSSGGYGKIVWTQNLSTDAAQRGAIAFAPGGKTLGVLEGDDLVLRDAATGKETRRLRGGRNSATNDVASDASYSTTKLVFSPDGKSAASCRDGLLSLWKLR